MELKGGVSGVWESFKKKLLETEKLNVPMTQIKKHKKANWITLKATKAVKKKHRLVASSLH